MLFQTREINQRSFCRQKNAMSSCKVIDSSRRRLGAVANCRHFVSNERCSFERGGVSKLVRLEEKIGISGLLRVVLHGFLVVSVTKKIITNFALRTLLTWRPSWPSPSLSTSSAELIRDLHDLAPSLALSVMRRTNGGRYAPTPLKKKHEKSPSVEQGTSQAFPKVLRRTRYHHVYRIM